MTNVTMKSDSFEPATDTAAQLFDNWFDPIESGLRELVRDFIDLRRVGRGARSPTVWEGKD
jgi:putative transposase